VTAWYLRATQRTSTHDDRTEKGAANLAFRLLNKPTMSKSVIGPPITADAFALAPTVSVAAGD
jgi:hypothetical protein